MRVLFYTITFFLSGTLVAQVNTEIPATNSNVPANSTNLNYQNEAEEVKSEELLDTVVIIESTTIKAVSVEAVKKIERRDERLEKPANEPSSPRKAKTRMETDAVTPAPAATADDVKDSFEDAEAEEVTISVEKESSSLKKMEMEKVSGGFSNTNMDADRQRSSRSPSYQQQAMMNEAVDYFEVNAPESFEHYYFKYVAGNYDVSLYSDLKKAEEIRPENADVHVQMAGYFMIQNDVDTALMYTEKLLESNRLTDNVVSYAGDILRSTPENGALITHGFDDGYACYYAQNEQGIRPDVTLISLDFLQSEEYRNNLVEKGFVLPTSTVVNIDYLVDFCAKNSEKGIGISMTTPKEYLQPIQDKLYVVGLIFEYHTDAYNNFTRNDYLWNESLEKHLIAEPGDEKGKQLSANYLPMLLHLQKVYSATGETEKLTEVDEVSDQIGVQCGKYEQVQKVKAKY
jgi:hypothetical protein